MASVTLLPIQDVYISEWYSDQNFDTHTGLFVSQYKQPGDDYRSLFQFDLSCIPPTSTIHKAVFELKVNRNEGTCGILIQAHRLLNKWTEWQLTWENCPPLSPELDGSEFIEPESPPDLVCIEITSLVRGWYDGSIPNNGLILIGNETENDLIGFISTRGTYSYEWPRLKVDYSPGLLNRFQPEKLIVPRHDCPYIESRAIPLGPKEKATFIVVNTSDSEHVRALLQVGYSSNPDKAYADAGEWRRLKPAGFPGEAVSLSTTDAVEFARVLIEGRGGETVIVHPRTREL